MIPHMGVFPVNAEWRMPNAERIPDRDWSLPRFSLLDPAFDVALLAGADREGARRHVLADSRAGSDVGTRVHGDGRNQLGIAADEGAVLDHRRMLVRSVVVARDRARADVHLFA